MTVPCRACGGEDLLAFFQVRGVPTQSCVLLDDVEAARRYQVGDIHLSHCRSCGFIQNDEFDQDKVDYSVPTEESQAFSPRFQDFSAGLARHLWSRYGLQQRSVLEIGCGKGDFLNDLYRMGVASATGIDPGFLPRGNGATDGPTFIRDFFDGRYAHLEADLVVARHLLEHIPNVLEFMWSITSVMAVGSSVFVEVPDTERILVEGAFWDVYYEHCAYFTATSLGGLVARSGLTSTRMSRGFGDQYLLAEADMREAVPGRTEVEPQPAEDLAHLTVAFEVSAREGRERWTRRLAELNRSDGSVVLWGGSSKTIAFLSAVDVGSGRVRVVDINPHKQHKFLPASGIEVESPSALVDEPPRLVVVMNPVYREEIDRSLQEMGVASKVLAVND